MNIIEHDKLIQDVLKGNSDCAHIAATKIKVGKIQCDNCGEIMNCQHDFDLDVDGYPYCWVCDYEIDPDIYEDKYHVGIT